MFSPNNPLTTPLHKAVAKGNLEKIQQLLKSGADINCTDFLGVTPLQSSLLFAIRSHHHFYGEPRVEDVKNFKKITEFLLMAGADVNSRDHLGRTAIFYALAKYSPILVVSTEEFNNPHVKKDYLNEWKKDFLSEATQTLGLNTYDNERVQDLKGQDLEDLGASIVYHYGTFGRFDTEANRNFIETYNEDFSILYSLLELGADLTVRDHDEKTIFNYILPHRDCITTSKIAIKFFAKIEDSLKKEASVKIREEILSSNFADVYHQCKTEIKILREKKIVSSLSYFDILSKPEFKVAKYIKVDTLSKIQKSGEFEKYEMYRKILELKAKKAAARTLLYQDCINVIHNFYISDRVLPFLICDKILSFLPTHELASISEITY